MEKGKVLFVDDENDLLENASLLLGDHFKITTADSVDKAKGLLRDKPFDVAVVDLNFEGHDQDGLDLLDFILKNQPSLPIVVLSGRHRLHRALEAAKRPLVDFIVKEGDYFEKLKVAIDRGIDRKRKWESDREIGPKFLTNSTSMMEVLNQVDRVTRASNHQCSILILGETGTGKEVLARYIAGRLKLPIVTANMASIPKDTAESILFGHMKGAFTGAHSNTVGLMERAHNGIFFLDEIGDCSLDIQAKLLRALQEKEITPVGGSPKKITARFIAATNRNLEEMVERGLFRLDLLQRINTITVTIPPLRLRPEDITLFTTRFIEEFSPNQFFHITPGGMNALYDYSWNGNVRELRAIINRLVILSDSRTIDGNMVKAALRPDSKLASAKLSLEANKNEVIKEEIMRALEAENGNRERAAQRMGIHRATFFRWIKKFDLGEKIFLHDTRKVEA